MPANLLIGATKVRMSLQSKLALRYSVAVSNVIFYFPMIQYMKEIKKAPRRELFSVRLFKPERRLFV
jgi:hypothetical protein